MSPRLDFALKAARAAGDSTLEAFRQPRAFEFKGDSTPVTAADRRAEAIIRERIEAEFPGETVLGEEQGLVGVSRDRWVVDPIDGTKSFIAGVPLYATLLSWEEAGEPLVGVAYFPALELMLWAEKGGGAFANGSLTQVRDETDPKQSIICHGSLRTLEEQGRLPGFFDLAGRSLAAKGWSDAYGYALVATGRAQAMIDPIVSHWDISSVSLIVREAGALFTTLDGREALENQGLAVVPGMQAMLLEAMRT
jgi:myo-inositol-1(or 4)-monophosphatase